MDAVQKQVLKPKAYEPIKYQDSYHMERVFQHFQHFRDTEVMCDIKLETDDGSTVVGHKLVFISTSPYFRAMFTCFEESNKDRVHIKEMDSKVLRLLVDYMYTGNVMVTEENVQVLLAAADLLQIEYVKRACSVFLQTQLDPTNCLGFKALADLYNCTKLLSVSETFIKKYFLEVIKHDEFLSLSPEELIKLISWNDISVPVEEKVYECVINWVKHELDCRKKFLPQLIEHVRLTLISKNYILEKVVKQPLLTNNPKCKDFVYEVLHFNLMKSVHPFSIPQTAKCKPRQSCSLHKIVLVMSVTCSGNRCVTHWYNPVTNKFQDAPEISIYRDTAGICVLNDKSVFVVGGVYSSNDRSIPKISSRSVETLDTSSYSLYWASTKFDLLVSRKHLGVGVIDNCIYAVGGYDDSNNSNYNYHNEYLKSAEVFDYNTKKWRMIASMSNKRSFFGVGVLNKHLYAIGGFNGSSNSKTVECYDPTIDTWKPVADMSLGRSGIGVGVLDGVLYAIGGRNVSVVHKSVEAYRESDGIWTPVADMHVCRHNPGVVAFNGLLYVIGGVDGSTVVDSVEIYNPNTNSWIIKPLSAKQFQIYGAVVLDIPRHLRTNI